MLLTFPVEPPHKDEMLEIIAESVYANSSTLDGKRFANNFYTKRKEDAIDRVGAGSKNGAAKVTSLADSKSL
jgi:PERQ amino acid-rich with GYF domain-containing protein